MSSETIKNNYSAAIIGVGKAAGSDDASKENAGFRIGYTHAGMYARNPRVTLAAGADINQANLEAFQSEFDVAAGFNDFNALFAEIKPDIVSICTYVGLHRPMMEAAARAGVKMVMCEKPFVNSPADLQAIKEIASETGIKICAMHVRRYAPSYQRAAQLFQSGAVGKPLLCITAVGGWDLSEMASHQLDALRQFNGDKPLEWVMGQMRVRDARSFGHAMEEHALAFFKFEDGARGLVEAGESFNDDGNYLLIGTEGTIRCIGFDTVVVQDENGRRSENLAQEGDVTWDGLWDIALEEALSWLDGGAESQIGLSTVSRTAELNLAAYVSAIRGDRVDFPLSDELNEWPVETLARRHAAQENAA